MKESTTTAGTRPRMAPGELAARRRTASQPAAPATTPITIRAINEDGLNGAKSDGTMATARTSAVMAAASALLAAIGMSRAAAIAVSGRCWPSAGHCLLFADGRLAWPGPATRLN